MKANQIFINLPVKNVVRATPFYTAIGASLQPDFSNEQASCMKFNDRLYVMLLDEAYFSTFTPLPVANAQAATQVLLAVAQDSREEVDALLHTVLQAGGKEPRPVQDLGFMYSRAFADVDGHIWEAFWMNSEKPSV